MAGEYGVNINLRVKGQSGLDRLKQKVNQLSASVDKIRSIDIMNPRGTGGKAGKSDRNQIKKYRQDMEALVKTVNNSRGAFGKTANQQMAAADALQEYANNLKIGTKAHAAATAATEKQVRSINSETNALMKNNQMRKKNKDLANRIGGFGGRRGARGGGGSGALQSALVSGAFPLLFGQGPLGAAAGFTGGFIGTKMGGQMGGFAGGLVATAVLQQFQQITQSVAGLGNALSKTNLDITKVSQALGLVGTPSEEYLKLLEQTEGKQAAFNESMKRMTRIVGEDGVKELQAFGEGVRQFTNDLNIFLTRMAAGFATFANKIRNEGLLGFGGLSKFTKPFERSGLIRRAELSDDPKMKELIAERTALIGGKTGSDLGKLKRTDTFKELEQRIVDQQKINELLGKETDILALNQMKYEQITKSMTDQIDFLNNAITLGQGEAEIIREKNRLIEAARKAGIKFDEDEIDRQVRLQRQLEKLNTLYAGIASTIETGLVDAIEGAIQGTKTLGDVARSVFTQIQRSLIQFGVNSLLGSIPGIGGFFRADGGSVSKGKSYIVGERGPEMFTPGSSGMITPNHELGGSSTNVVVNVDASGSSVEGDEQRGRELGRLISVAVQSELLEQKRPGGLLA
jgi:hypothetical protein